VDPLWHRLKQVLQELPRRLAVGFLDQLSHGELAGSVKGHKELELAFSSPDLGNIDMERTDRVAFELLPLGFVPIDI